MTQPISSQGLPAPLPSTVSRTQAPAGPADTFVPSVPSESLPTRAMMSARVQPAGLPQSAAGSVNGRPFQMDASPNGDGTWQVTGEQNGQPLGARLVPTGTGSRIEGHQNGQALYVEIDRQPDGSVHLEGRRNNRALVYDLRPAGNGDLVAVGAQDGMDSSFRVRPGAGQVRIAGELGGQRADLSFVERNGNVDAAGSGPYSSLEVRFPGTSLSRLGDYLPGLSIPERAAVLFALLSAAPRG